MRLSSILKISLWYVQAVLLRRIKKITFCMLVLPPSNYLPEQDLWELWLKFKRFSIVFQFLECKVKCTFPFKASSFPAFLFLSGWEVVSLASWKKDGKWWKFTKIKSINSCKLIYVCSQLVSRVLLKLSTLCWLLSKYKNCLVELLKISGQSAVT